MLDNTSRLRYNEAYNLLIIILKHTSSIPNKPVSDFFTRSFEVINVLSNTTIQEAAEKMIAGGFTQLPVIDEYSRRCVGIITDWAILRRMMNPKKLHSK